MHYKKVLKPKNAIKESFNVYSNTTNTENNEDDISDDSDDDVCDSMPTDNNFKFLTTYPSRHFDFSSLFTTMNQQELIPKNWILK